MKNKGFAISGILYPILVLVIFLVVQILMVLGTRKVVLDQNSKRLLETINNENKVYTNEELSSIITELQNQFQGLKAENNNLKNELSKYTLLTKHEELNHFIKEKFPTTVRADQTTASYQHSCGTKNSIGVRKFIEDSWNSFEYGLSMRTVNMGKYGCNYTAMINKIADDYGTIILTGYDSNGAEPIEEAIIVGNVAFGKFCWSITNMTGL